MTLTIEELKYGAEVGDLGIDAVRAVCAEALANREAQPVGWLYDGDRALPPMFVLGGSDPSEYWKVRYVQVYTAPPAPAVPVQPVSQSCKLDGWIACAEQMPESTRKDQYFITYRRCKSNTGGISIDLFIGGCFAFAGITHWMPLPAAPQPK